MNSMFKVKLLQQKGLSREAAMEQVIQDLDAKCRQMDLTLAKCVEKFPDEMIAIMGIE